jgi:hypothetical protein
MFGHLARHVIQSERRVPGPGSCSAGEGERRTKTDGWYIDLPGAYPQGHGYEMDVVRSAPTARKAASISTQPDTAKMDFPSSKQSRRSLGAATLPGRKSSNWMNRRSTPKRSCRPRTSTRRRPCPNASPATSWILCDTAGRVWYATPGPRRCSNDAGAIQLIISVMSGASNQNGRPGSSRAGFPAVSSTSSSGRSRATKQPSGRPGKWWSWQSASSVTESPHYKKSLHRILACQTAVHGGTNWLWSLNSLI